MATKKIEIQDSNGNVYYPHTDASVVANMPKVMKNPNALTISLNGTSQGAYDGSAAKSINITPGNIGAAPSNHGNHVPATQTAANNKFLRNDNTWQTVTPGNIGAYTKSEIDTKVSNINASLNALGKFYVATLSSTNVYKVTTGLNKTSLASGYSIRVAIPSDSTGAVSLIVDSCSAVAIKQSNGNAVTKLKKNGVYSLTYYNSVFILASGGGADTVNFTSDKLLTGYSANDSNGEKIDGGMINLSQSSTISFASGNGTKVLKADEVFQQKNTDNVDRFLLRYNGNSGYITGNTLLGFPRADVANAIGLTADKIVEGNNILGITGTAQPMKTLEYNSITSGSNLINFSGDDWLNIPIIVRMTNESVNYLYYAYITGINSRAYLYLASNFSRSSQYFIIDSSTGNSLKLYSNATYSSVKITPFPQL